MFLQRLTRRCRPASPNRARKRGSNRKAAEMAGDNPEAAIKDGANGDGGAFDAARAARICRHYFKGAQTRM
jgi:hypothetical protein